MKEQSTTKGFAMLSLAAIIAKVFSLIYVPFLTRILGSEGMGIYFQVYDVFVFIYALLNIGIQMALSKYVSELSGLGNHKDALKAFKMTRAFLFFFGGFLTFLLMFSSRFIAKGLNNNQIIYGLIFLSPAILITSLFAVYKGYFQGINNMKPLAIATVLEQIANVIFSLIFAAIFVKVSIPLGSAGGTLGTSLGALLALVYLVYIFYVLNLDKLANKNQDPNIKRLKNKAIIRKISFYAFPIMLSSGLQNFGNVIDMANVQSRLLYAGYTLQEANTMYGLLGQWRTLINIPLLFATALGTVILPVISKAYILNDRKTIKEKIAFAYRFTYLLAIPSTFGLAVLSKEIYKYIYGNTNGYYMMVIGSVVVILMSIVLIQNIVLQAVSKFYYVIGTLIIGLTVKFISNYVLVGNKNINIFGAIIGFILCFLISMILNQKKIKKALAININNLKLFIKPLAASIYMTIGIFITKTLIYMVIDFDKFNTLTGIMSLLIMIIIGGVLYLHGIIILGAVKKDDILTFSPKLYNKIPNYIKNKLV